MPKSKTTEPETPAMMSAMLALSPAATSAWMEVMTESARFVSDRLQQDMATQKDLLACKTPAELMKVQSEFFQSAMSQYMEEAQKLMSMMTEAGEKTAKDIAEAHKRSYDDVPL